MTALTFTSSVQHIELPHGRRSLLRLVAGGALLATTAEAPLPTVADRDARSKRRALRRQRRDDWRFCGRARQSQLSAAMQEFPSSCSKRGQ